MDLWSDEVTKAQKMSNQRMVDFITEMSEFDLPSMIHYSTTFRRIPWWSRVADRLSDTWAVLTGRKLAVSPDELEQY